MSDLVKTLRQEAIQDNPDYVDEDYRTKSADTIEQLQQRVGELESEIKESNDDLRGTQKSLSDAEAVIEEIQCSFCDDDACPLFEPFNTKNMWEWINSRSRLDKSRISDLEESAFNYKKERDALAAHVQRLELVAIDAINEMEKDAVGYSDKRDLFWNFIAEQSPQSSLAEHDAEVFKDGFMCAQLT